MNEREIYLKALSKWGVEPQCKMAIEEMAELTNALMKYDRGRNTVEDIIEEIADVIIMMRQMSLIFGEEAVSKQINYKLNRLSDRLNKN